MFKTDDLVVKQLANLFGVIFGSTCPACGRISATICKSCRETLDGCNSGVGDDEKSSDKRRDSTQYHGDVLVAFKYDSTIRKVILSFKYRNQRSSLRLIGDALVRRVHAEQSRLLKKIDIVTWAPTTQKRVIERGYDHAELIAKYVAKRLQLPCQKVLVRLSDRPQTGKSRDARLVGPSFLARNLNSEHLLLVDDVVTTGATLNSATHALYQAGAGLVTCMAVASTVLWQSSTESYALAKARK